MEDQKEFDKIWESPPSRGAWIEIAVMARYWRSQLGSPPSRGAWIEILMGRSWASGMKSPPSRGAWIEITIRPQGHTPLRRSPPTRGAWIEIFPQNLEGLRLGVAPLAGGVD